MQSVYFKEQRLKKYASLNNSHIITSTKITQTGDFYKNTSSEQSIFVSYGAHACYELYFYFVSLGSLCVRDAGCKGNKITACLILLFVLTLIFTLYQNSWIILITFALLADWLNISTLFLFFSKQTSIESILVTKIKIIFMYNTNQSLFNYW